MMYVTENALCHSALCLITGKPLQLHLQACDVKSKEEKAGPENMLAESSTADGTTETILIPLETTNNVEFILRLKMPLA